MSQKNIKHYEQKQEHKITAWCLQHERNIPLQASIEHASFARAWKSIEDVSFPRAGQRGRDGRGAQVRVSQSWGG